MSDTPRTDSLIASIVSNPGLEWTHEEIVLLGEFARQLERELNKVNAFRERLKRRCHTQSDLLNEYHDIIDHLRAKVDELERKNAILKE